MPWDYTGCSLSDANTLYYELDTPAAASIFDSSRAASRPLSAARSTTGTVSPTTVPPSAVPPSLDERRAAVVAVHGKLRGLTQSSFASQPLLPTRPATAGSLPARHTHTHTLNHAPYSLHMPRTPACASPLAHAPSPSKAPGGAVPPCNSPEQRGPSQVPPPSPPHFPADDSPRHHPHAHHEESSPAAARHASAAATAHAFVTELPPGACSAPVLDYAAPATPAIITSTAAAASVQLITPGAMVPMAGSGAATAPPAAHAHDDRLTAALMAAGTAADVERTCANLMQSFAYGAGGGGDFGACGAGMQSPRVNASSVNASSVNGSSVNASSIESIESHRPMPLLLSESPALLGESTESHRPMPLLLPESPALLGARPPRPLSTSASFPTAASSPAAAATLKQPPAGPKTWSGGRACGGSIGALPSHFVDLNMPMSSMAASKREQLLQRAVVASPFPASPTLNKLAQLRHGGGTKLGGQKLRPATSTPHLRAHVRPQPQSAPIVRRTHLSLDATPSSGGRPSATPAMPSRITLLTQPHVKSPMMSPPRSAPATRGSTRPKAR